MPVSAHGPSRHLAPAQQLRRFGTKADIEWQATPTGSVAIDATRTFGPAKLAGFLTLCSHAPGRRDVHGWTEGDMPIEASNDPNAFRAFEHAGWNAVSRGYEEAVGPLTAQSADVTLDAAGVAAGQIARHLFGTWHPGARGCPARSRGQRPGFRRSDDCRHPPQCAGCGMPSG